MPTKDRSTYLRKTPKMSHVHYAYLAGVIADAVEGGKGDTASTLDQNNAAAAWKFAFLLADKLKGTNPAYNRDRFLTACGVV